MKTLKMDSLRVSDTDGDQQPILTVHPLNSPRHVIPDQPGLGEQAGPA